MKSEYNKLINKDKKQLAFTRSSLILTNYFLPLNEAFTVRFWHKASIHPNSFLSKNEFV